jgi:ABC-2 type transport system permease protein
MPIISFVVIIATQLVILLITSVLLLGSGMNPLTTVTHTALFQNSLILLYALIALSFWHAPTYAWALLVSAWVRRATFLWAVLPIIAISIFERVTFGTSYFSLFIRDRFMSWAAEAFALRHGPKGTPILDSLSQLTPGRYLITPGLWLGLLFAAICLALVVRLRRHQGPI